MKPATTLAPHAMQALRRHLRFPLPISSNLWVRPSGLRIVREAVGQDGQDVPQPWLAHTTTPCMDPWDRRRLDLNDLRPPQPCAAATNGAALHVAERRKCDAYPELPAGGPKQLMVLGFDVGGRGARRFVRESMSVSGGPRLPPRCCTCLG